ncbi:MAG: transposase [Alphaproteobacteria bacterium]|nr:transposase [Alphaproteobacteria bacterium]
MLSSEALAGPVEIWCQDEARVGQKGMTTRVWANGKQRPRIVRDHRYGSVSLFAATCAERGVGIAHVADKANTASMNEHLAAIGAAVAPGTHGVVVLDGAGWRRSGDLLVPPT